jgi:hypothetical protein
MSTTNIEVTISDLGENAGTIGWLLKQPIKIHIGPCKHENAPGCWVRIGDKSELVALEGYTFYAYVGFSAKVGIHNVPVNRCEAMGADDSTCAFKTSFTDAAWAKVREIIDLARQQFQSALEARDTAEGNLVANFAVTKV